jgi:hypothetical protein
VCFVPLEVFDDKYHLAQLLLQFADADPAVLLGRQRLVQGPSATDFDGVAVCSRVYFWNVLSAGKEHWLLMYKLGNPETQACFPH